MRWPWVARSAYELALARLDRAEARLDTLLEHGRRLDRVGAGMTEEPRAAREEELMPEDLREYVLGWGTGETQASVEADLWRLYRRLRSWDAVRERVAPYVDAESAEPT